MDDHNTNITKANPVEGVYAIWWREFKVFLREKPRIISVLVSPIIWFLVFSAGFGPSIKLESFDYTLFLFCGVLVQTFLFSSLFYGAYLVWDRKIDVLKAVLVSPLSRAEIFIGKVLGGVTIAVIESTIFMLLGMLLGIQIAPQAFALALLAVAFTAAGLCALGLTVGSFMESPEGFQLLSSLVLFPLYFLSGALFPVTNLTGILGLLAKINPVTYIVDMIRGIITGITYFDMTTNISLVFVFLIASHAIGIWAFTRMKN